MWWAACSWTLQCPPPDVDAITLTFKTVVAGTVETFLAQAAT